MSDGIIPMAPINTGMLMSLIRSYLGKALDARTGATVPNKNQLTKTRGPYISKNLLGGNQTPDQNYPGPLSPMQPVVCLNPNST